MEREILFDLRDPEESRAAVLEDGRLAELVVEPDAATPRRGDIHLGVVVRIEPAVGAAFVDIGSDRPAFLHADDIMPTSADAGDDAAAFAARRRGGVADIRTLLRPGQRLIVQISREGVGVKGPAATTFLSLAGTWLVLMPSLERVGVSRRVADAAVRERARAAMAALEPPPGMGFIVRTAGAGRSPEELRADYDALMARFRSVVEAGRGPGGPRLLLREENLVRRVLRDHLADDLVRVTVDGGAGFEEARALLEMAAPGRLERLHRHDDLTPLFHARGIEAEIDRLSRRRVPLPSGAFLLIEPTEALVAIDVNSGKSVRGADLEETALRTDLAAAREVARQVRLRDLGGLIVVDFIDVRLPANRLAVDAAVAEAFSADRGRVRIAPMSEFGLVQITRRKRGPSLRQTLHRACPGCGGSGVVSTDGAGALRALREARAAAGAGARAVVLRAAPGVEAWLRARRAGEIDALARGLAGGLALRAEPDLAPGAWRVDAT